MQNLSASRNTTLAQLFGADAMNRDVIISAPIVQNGQIVGSSQTGGKVETHQPIPDASDNEREARAGRVSGYG
jgi:hypothetical protein